MQLKLKRSQRDGGLMKDTAIFCLDARVEYSPQEQQDISRYRLAGQCIYNSEASKRTLAAADAAAAHDTLGGNFKSLGLALLAGMKLNISIGSLAKGQHIECKSLEELLGAEDALLEACKNLKAFLEAAATFDGREVIVDFDRGEPAVVAMASSPSPQLIAPERAPLPPALAPLALDDASASLPPPFVPPPEPMHQSMVQPLALHRTGTAAKKLEKDQILVLGIVGIFLTWIAGVFFLHWNLIFVSVVLGVGGYVLGKRYRII